jgi:hypothetical protein
MSSLKKQAKQRKRKQTKEKKKQTEGKGIYASLRSLGTRNKEQGTKKREGKGIYASLCSLAIIYSEGRKKGNHLLRKERKETRKEQSKAKQSKARKGARQRGKALYKNCHINMPRVPRKIVGFRGFLLHSGKLEIELFFGSMN